MEIKQSTRIQTSVLNGVEKKALVWLAERQPRWVTSDLLTFIGFLGALTVAAGFILSNLSVQWLWLSSLGLVINWYGDSLDGTLARVRNTQRPIYGYYVDHTIDCVNEGLMFIGVGLSPFVHLNLALIAYALYLIMTINVSINAHLKGEFKLTYAKLGPTEFRLVIIIMDTILIAFAGIRNWSRTLQLFGSSYELHMLDCVAIAVIVILLLMLVFTFLKDAKGYAMIDPKKQPKTASDKPVAKDPSNGERNE